MQWQLSPSWVLQGKTTKWLCRRTFWVQPMCHNRQYACSNHHDLCILSWSFHIPNTRKYSSFFLLSSCKLIFLSEKAVVTEVVAQNLGIFISSEVINGQFITGLVWEPAINTGTKVWFRWPFWFLSMCTDNNNTKTPVSEYYVVTSSLFPKGHCPSSVSSTNQLVT